MLVGRIMLARLLQPSNVFLPIEVTPSGMVMDLRLSHQANAHVPIELTLEGIMILSKPLHP
jgi:hypothetical protein